MPVSCVLYINSANNAQATAFIRAHVLKVFPEARVVDTNWHAVCRLYTERDPAQVAVDPEGLNNAMRANMIRQQQIAAQKLQKQQQQPQPQQSGYDARKPQLEDWPPHQYHPRLMYTFTSTSRPGKVVVGIEEYANEAAQQQLQQQQQQQQQHVPKQVAAIDTDAGMEIALIRLKNTWLPRIAATIAGFIISVGSEFTLKIGNVGLANSAGFRGISIEAIFHPASTVDMTIPQLHGTSGLAKDCRGILREFMEMCIPPQMGINLDVLIQAESCVMIIPPSHPLRVWPSDEGSELLPELSQQIKPSHCHPFNEMHTGCQYIFLLRKHNIL